MVTKGSQKESIFWDSVDRVGSDDGGFSCIDILDLTGLLVSSSQLKGWMLFVWKFIQADLTS